MHSADISAAAGHPADTLSPDRVSVAPMMDWTDRHCRYFHRLLTRRALLYTEMVTTGALLHGDVARHLRFDAEEHPVALQLGGSEPADLAHCARLGARWGYDEINLNCGCPSERVQRGAFGACLMAEPQLVADGVKAMVDAVGIPVTVKHRIGIDRSESYDFVRDFVGTVSEAGCSTFIVHARNAWLQGPVAEAEPRDPAACATSWCIGSSTTFRRCALPSTAAISAGSEVHGHLRLLDGVMVGREAYHNPWWLAEWDADVLRRAAHRRLTREEVEMQMCDYMAREAAEHGTPWPSIARHMLGLRHGLPARARWRQVWSDHRLKVAAAARGDGAGA